MSQPDLDRLQEMLGDDWILTDHQRAILTAWWDARMSGETLSVYQGRHPAVTDTTKRGTRLPEGWVPSDAIKAQLSEQYPSVNLILILQEFRDYWCAVPGQRGLKLSWERTFRNRVREVAHKPQYHLRGQGAPRQMSRVDAKAAAYLTDD